MRRNLHLKRSYVELVQRILELPSQVPSQVLGVESHARRGEVLELGVEHDHDLARLVVGDGS
jgi:hypothetical protein